jgi:pimeloyl-ACP methyl ester carboxylesterase
VYKWLSTEYPEDQIVVYGRSLGSGIGARIASWNHPRMLILDSPYLSFYYQIRQYAWWIPLRYLLRYHLRTDQFLKKITCPIFIIHGNKDRLISYKQGKKLHELSADRSTMEEWPPSLRSGLTMLLYLNGPADGVQGGSTRLYRPDRSAVDVTPRKGAALFFRHGFSAQSVLHAGSRVFGSVSKYVARINVMYAEN